MRLMGGRLCLDFLNTNAFRSGTPREWLTTYDQLLTFAARTAALEPAELETLRGVSLEHPKQAAAVTELARTWREALYNAVVRSPAQTDLQTLNAVIAAAHTHRQLSHTQDGYAWTWTAPHLELPLWAIALDAAALLADGLATRVRTCPGHDCGWVFLDAGRGKPRRWCAMDLCGNRAKIKEFRSKHQVKQS
jgi:predicted RNA-binding Zn ribbon-like protein